MHKIDHLIGSLRSLCEVETNDTDRLKSYVRENPEDDFLVSDLLMRIGPDEFRPFMRGVVRDFKERNGRNPKIDLIFSIEDPSIGKFWLNKTVFLRYLKAALEGYTGLRGSINSILVKGPKETIDLEPNVSASGVTFSSEGFE